MQRIIGQFEISSIARSFIKSYGDFNHGGEDKAELIHTLYDVDGNSILTVLFEIWNLIYLLIDAMQDSQKLKKADFVKNMCFLTESLPFHLGVLQL